MSTLRISLRAGERIFVNGAVMRVDRKTSIEFLNDVAFLLEGHVLQASEAKTPLRQLYFIVQMILIDPANAAVAKEMFARSRELLLGSFKTPEILAGLEDIDDMVGRNRPFDALKRLRSLIPLEDAIMGSVPDRHETAIELETPRIAAQGAR
ncbi:flagellar biosynthesis repressor FlbT [Mangrovibrevibacter kandeliae]|uniref:flagellar biosynthesis repressor FlbT n=1 Tax=Mangrovibrevibacter kandeliae TaxID=2968473 RepID=UPI002119B5E6|nr:MULTISPECIES: flagellar biosynthesis repressor FlbT [unclassified Aurantimonas]MCQ8780936.1 flagellar biosynthesis repressor FlbT [Aurantimonas sp. CSK15Z-1]MCW4113717.1 flagellar biosynthesis repressor FlbT [Aurantimonas sp. MSK8Z-1]